MKETFDRIKPGFSDSAPPSESLSTVVVTITAGVLNTVELTFTGQPASNYYAMVYMTSQMSTGVMSPKKSAFRLIASQNVPSTPFELEVKTQYQARFGIPSADSKIFCKVIFIDSDTGQTYIAGQAFARVVEV